MLLKKNILLYWLLFLSLTGSILPTSAQPIAASGHKPILDTSALGKFPAVFRGGFSSAGSYFHYNIDQSPIGPTLFIQAVDNSWKREYPGVSAGYFSTDEKQVF